MKSKVIGMNKDGQTEILRCSNGFDSWIVLDGVGEMGSVEEAENFDVQADEAECVKRHEANLKADAELKAEVMKHLNWRKETTEAFEARFAGKYGRDWLKICVDGLRAELLIK